MSQVILFQTEGGAPAMMVPAPGGSVDALLLTLPVTTPSFVVDADSIPATGVAGLLVDFDTQTVTAKPLDRAQVRADALARIDQEHAKYLEALTGGATPAERDTWKPKEEAARAVLADTATAGQTDMIAAEAASAGITAAQLATKIVAKADAFLHLIGVAGGIRAQARAAITAATDEAVALDQVEASVAAVFAQLAQDVQAAITQLQNPNAHQQGGNSHA